jgi:hypothetical protein
MGYLICGFVLAAVYLVFVFAESLVHEMDPIDHLIAVGIGFLIVPLWPVLTLAVIAWVLWDMAQDMR